MMDEIKEEPLEIDSISDNSSNDDEIKEIKKEDQNEPLKWNKTSTLEFLELFFTENVLWNPNHSDSKNRLKIYMAWKRIERKFGRGIGYKELKKKKVSLYCTFRQWRKEKLKGCGKQIKWYAYDMMEKHLGTILHQRSPKIEQVIDHTESAHLESTKQETHTDNLSSVNQLSKEQAPSSSRSYIQKSFPQDLIQKKLFTNKSQRLKKLSPTKVQPINAQNVKQVKHLNSKLYELDTSRNSATNRIPDNNSDTSISVSPSKPRTKRISCNSSDASMNDPSTSKHNSKRVVIDISDTSINTSSNMPRTKIMADYSSDASMNDPSTSKKNSKRVPIDISNTSINTSSNTPRTKIIADYSSDASPNDPSSSKQYSKRVAIDISNTSMKASSNTLRTETLEDDISDFATFITTKLRKFIDKRKRLDAQRRILDVIYEMELEELDSESN